MFMTHLLILLSFRSETAEFCLFEAESLYISPAGLELTDFKQEKKKEPASVSWLLGLRMCTTMPA